MSHDGTLPNATKSHSEHAQGNQVRPGEWTAETVAAFWDYHAQKTPPGGYFSEVLAEGLIRVAKWQGQLQRGTRVVDFGCGRGPLIDALLKQGDYSVGGVEFSTESAKAVDERFATNAHYLGTQVIGQDAPWDQEAFNTAFCIEVVEHLTDEFLMSTLTALADCLQPGGAAIITTPFDENLPAHQVFCPFCKTEFHHMQHVRSWNEASLASALAHVGLNTIFCAPVRLARFCYGRPLGRRDKIIASVQSGIRASLAAVSSKAAFRYAASQRGDNLVAIAIKGSR